GTVPDRPVTTADAGNVIELSVQARNGLGVTGNTLTDNTQSNGGQGNITDGNNGQAVDANAVPKINNLTVVQAADLQPGSIIRATYDFDANNGDPQDISTFVWSNPNLLPGSTASEAPQGQTIVNSGTVPDRLLTANDNGQVVEVSVSPRNGRNTRGTTVTAKTKHAVGYVLAASYFADAQGNGKIPGVSTWIWIRDPNDNYFAPGQFTFTSKGFTSTSTTGTLYVNADDKVDKVVLNGTEISLGTCVNDWRDRYCTAQVTNLKTNGSNTVSVTATNNPGVGSGNPGSVGILIRDASSNPLISTDTVSDWTYD
ncbi:TPA: hypothetical protein N5O02_004405, partial [Enterobacter asburiae]|nr:hypothetical protein [Enterobacter asburiae]